MKQPTNLIVVCCHGIWTGGPSNGRDESEWLIADFQKGETPTFIEHIKAGLAQLKIDTESLLVFSGGPTRKETRLSEAQSYANLAKANGYFDVFTPSESESGALRCRILVDEQSLDSYHNVLFSLVKFWRHRVKSNGGGGISARASWPLRLAIVSHAFKKRRIVDGHCAALGFPLERVSFVGIDPLGMSSDTPDPDIDGSGVVEKPAAMAGVQQAVDQWDADPHGTGVILSRKRASRNPWGVNQLLFESEEERGWSGLDTRRIPAEGGIGAEVLVEDGIRPWAEIEA